MWVWDRGESCVIGCRRDQRALRISKEVRKKEKNNHHPNLSVSFRVVYNSIFVAFTNQKGQMLQQQQQKREEMGWDPCVCACMYVCSCLYVRVRLLCKRTFYLIGLSKTFFLYCMADVIIVSICRHLNTHSHPALNLLGTLTSVYLPLPSQTVSC